jgi:hypothetical protein
MFYFIAIFQLVMSILFYRDSNTVFALACLLNAFIALLFTRSKK